MDHLTTNWKPYLVTAAIALLTGLAAMGKLDPAIVSVFIGLLGGAGTLAVKPVTTPPAK